jgi:hypothetical protein
MGGEGDLEVAMVGHEMQILAKDVVALDGPKIVSEQLQVGGDIGKTFVANADRIKIDLEIYILMIERQKDVVPLQCWRKKIQMRMLNLMPKLMEFIYYIYFIIYCPTCPFKWRGQVGFFLSIFLLQYLR